MAKAQHIIRMEIDPANPLPEIADVINAVCGVQPTRELEILRGLVTAIQTRIDKLDGGEIADGKPVLQPGRDEKDPG